MYRFFADFEARGHSDTYFEWSNAIAEDQGILAMIDELPTRCRQPNLIFGSCRYLGVEPAPYGDFREFLVARWTEITELALVKRTQTNESGRCAVLLPVLASLPQPLALLEVGASAGLCLYPDKYSYVYDADHRIDPVDGPSKVVIACTTRGGPPLPEALPDVAWRAGIDLNPLDVRDEASMKWLEALVWPEEEFRLSRLRAAIEIARSEPPNLFAGDLVELIGPVAARAPTDATLVVFHSAVMAYLDADRRSAFEDQVRALPVTWVSNEGAGVLSNVGPLATAPHEPTQNLFVVARDNLALAYAGTHGQSLEWL
jgi:hypothetical protein